MKFSKLSQLFGVSSLGLLIATLLVACSTTTIDYVYVACAGGSGNGQIEAFAADSESGALRTGATTVSSGGVDPVAMVATSDYENLYVANKTTGNIVHFTIGSSGALTVEDSISITAPVSLAVNTAGTYLYVVSGTSSATLTEYPLTSGTIGTATASVALAVSGYTLVPSGIAILANNSTVSGNAVYATAYDATEGAGWVFGFTIGSGGALTAATNSPYSAGVKPTAIASDPANRFIYVTDYPNNHLIGYTILDGSTLKFMTSGPFTTGNEPSAVTVDPRGLFVYVANSAGSTVTAYAITLSTGVPTVVGSVSGTAAGTEPVAIVVDPALGRFVYTANYLDNSISGFRLNSTSGALSTTQATPYPTGSEPTSLVVVPHGNHATQTATP
jgi:6-phosphogluconolactonase